MECLDIILYLTTTIFDNCNIRSNFWNYDNDPKHCMVVQNSLIYNF